VGAVLSQENLKTPAARDCAAPATAVIVQVDGGHIPLKQRDKRSFEALSGVVCPESIRIDQHHREINSKSCLSAEDDHLATMKTYLLNAALKQGMKPDTVVTALADGACNCWSVILSLTLTANNCSASWIGFTSLRSFRMLGVLLTKLT